MSEPLPSARPLVGATTDALLPSREQVLVDACRRLQFAAGAAIFGLLVGFAVFPFAQPNVGGVRDGWSRPFELMPIGLLVSIAMYWVAGRQQLPAQRRLDAGLGYLVVMCLFTALFSHWLPYDNAYDVARGPSGVALATLVFATLVPMPAARLAAGVFAAALMDPLALLISTAFGAPMPRPGMWLWLFTPTFGSAAVAVFASRSLYDLSQKLEQARRMGAYQLESLIGAGGMGEVWRASHRSLARPAAVKLIRPDRLGQAAEATRKRFVREARTTAALQSPHTVDVYDFGVADDGSFYSVMELLEGWDLDALVRRVGPLPPARAAYLLAQACSSLHEAHEQGLVHRDVKPANLFACRRADELDFVKVLDFGLVQVESAPGESRLTAADALSGTPAFIAPEGLQGDVVDRRADVYALGCVAFFLLTGSFVFPGDNPMAMLLAHVQKPPPRPSDVREDVPAALDDLVLACLAKAPADRPATAAEVRRRLIDTGLVAAWTPERAAAAWAELSAESTGPDDPRYADTVPLSG